MKEIKFEELATKYPLEDVAPWGLCLVVPGVEFDPDWEVALGDQGFRCYNTNIGGKAVTLVQKRRAVPNGKMVYVPPKKDLSAGDARSKVSEKKTDIVRARARGGNNWQMVWRIEEDDLLIALWNRKPHLKVAEIVEEFRTKFPERSPGAVPNRISGLQQEGRIQSRFKPRRKGGKSGKSSGSVTEDTKGIEATKAPEDLSSPPLNSEVAGLAEAVGVLAGKVRVFEEAYEVLRKELVELKADVKLIGEEVAVVRGSVGVLIKHHGDLVRHKHAVGSGEAMLPMEAQ